jgi:YVTN family beta-propeller protein
MPSSRPYLARVSKLAALFAVTAAAALGFRCELPPGSTGFQTFASPQSRPIALSPDGTFLYVANTTSNSVSVIATAIDRVVDEIAVGLEPVGLAVRPDGRELWVSNHVSDSVSVIDLDPRSARHHSVIATIQDLDPRGVTRFDEPVGIAFASSQKAYVALSSSNDVAVIDTATRAILGRIEITAQDPRELVVRGGYLYVAAFESGNQSELSVCPAGPGQPLPEPPPQCTLGSKEVGDFVIEPNLPGRIKHIVVDPDVPDRDLFVIDTATDQVVDVVSGVGTLLYGLAASSAGDVYVAQTSARNAENGIDGLALIDLENRMFDNQVARVSCGGGSCGAPVLYALDPALPGQPGPADALATPYALALSGDDATLFGVAMGTSRIFALDAASGALRDVADLGAPAGEQIPRGLALLSDSKGKPKRAYVLNTLENSVSVVDVRKPDALKHLKKIAVGDDPTPEAVRKGRVAFMSAFASTHDTFSCESCHPDGNMDQLLWRIGGACFFGACSGFDEIRTTMPVRGLTGTLPLHWDGTLGDPFGGRNGATGPAGNLPPQCTDEPSCFRHLVDASLSGVMCDQDPSCAPGVSGLPGDLDAAARDAMAAFLASVSYPPSRELALSDESSESARAGFGDFFLDHGGVGDIGAVNTCGDMDSGCHALPLLASTNGPVLQGFDAPTLRGINDRFVQFSIGIDSAEEALVAARTGGLLPFGGINLFSPPSPVPWDPEHGFDEDVSFATSFAAFTGIYNVGPQDIFQMLNELGTGYSGAAGRQVTLSRESAGDAGTDALLAALEAAHQRGVVKLQGEGKSLPLRIPVAYRYDPAGSPAKPYVSDAGPARTRAELLSRAAQGRLVLTLTAALPPGYGRADTPQPLIAPEIDGRGAIGNPALPRVPTDLPVTLRGQRIRLGATLLVDGQPAAGSIECVGGSYTPFCSTERVRVNLTSPPTEPGLHRLQVQNPQGPLSNDLPICKGDTLFTCREAI